VADTESHALREVDLRSKTVKTLAGALIGALARVQPQQPAGLLPLACCLHFSACWPASR
jgi:hypothetical protein